MVPFRQYAQPQVGLKVVESELCMHMSASTVHLPQAFLGAGFGSSWPPPRNAPKLSLTAVSKASMASARCPAALSTRLLGDASSSRITKLCSPWAFFNSCCKPTAEKMVRKSSMASTSTGKSRWHHRELWDLRLESRMQRKNWVAENCRFKQTHTFKQTCA